MKINLVGGPRNGMLLEVNPDNMLHHITVADAPQPLTSMIEDGAKAEELIYHEHRYQLQRTLDGVCFYLYCP